MLWQFCRCGRGFIGAVHAAPDCQSRHALQAARAPENGLQSPIPIGS